MACRSNSMDPAASDINQGGEEKDREALLGLRAGRQGLCPPYVHEAGGQTKFQSRETEGDNDRWEENEQHGATCRCVEPQPQDYDWKSASLNEATVWRDHVSAGKPKVTS